MYRIQEVEPKKDKIRANRTGWDQGDGSERGLFFAFTPRNPRNQQRPEKGFPAVFDAKVLGIEVKNRDVFSFEFSGGLVMFGFLVYDIFIVFCLPYFSLFGSSSYG